MVQFWYAICSNDHEPPTCRTQPGVIYPGLIASIPNSPQDQFNILFFCFRMIWSRFNNVQSLRGSHWGAWALSKNSDVQSFQHARRETRTGHLWESIAQLGLSPLGTSKSTDLSLICKKEDGNFGAPPNFRRTHISLLVNILNMRILLLVNPPFTVGEAITQNTRWYQHIATNPSFLVISVSSCVD